jgi:cobalt-zinc-cadmium efflux system outer membrane protein
MDRIDRYQGTISLVRCALLALTLLNADRVVVWLPMRLSGATCALGLLLAPALWASESQGAAKETVPAPLELPSPLSLEDALRIFRARGLDLLIADAAVASAEGDLRIASALYNPSVNLSRGSSRNYDPALCSVPSQCADVSYGAGVTDQGAIFDLIEGKHHLRVKTAKAALEAAKMSRADAERTLSFTLKQQYLATVLAKDSLDFAKENLATSDETLRLVGVRYRAGAVSEADVARAETAKLEADQAVEQAVQALRQAKVALATLLGMRKAVPDFEVGQEFQRASVPERLAAPTPDSLLDVARKERPDLKAIAAQRARAAAALSLAKRQRLPDLPLSAQYAQEGTGQNAIQPPTTTFGLSLTIPLLYQNQGEVAKARADLRTQELQEAKLETQVVSDVETAIAGFVSARNRAERMDSRLLERAQRARDLVRIQYDKGAASLLELLDAQRTLISTEVERLQDLNDYWTAVFQLEAAVGEELRN